MIIESPHPQDHRGQKGKVARPDYWRLRIRELAAKIDEARALRCPEYVDDELKDITIILQRISEKQEPLEAAAS